MDLFVLGVVEGSQPPVFAITVLALGFVSAALIGSLAWFSSKRPLGWEDSSGPVGQAEASGPNYDRGIVPAETAARQAREGASFKQTPEAAGDIDTAGGYTTDREGHLNNYAIEPEMYVEEPGDLAGQEIVEAAERAEELQEVNQPGGKGPGII